jgi:hypothetical protein
MYGSVLRLVSAAADLIVCDSGIALLAQVDRILP